MENRVETLNTVVMMVCTDQELTEQLTQAVENCWWTSTFADFSYYLSNNRRPAIASQIAAANTALAFVDFDRDLDQAIETAQYLTQTFPTKVAVVALSSNQEPQVVLKALRAGCSEFLNKPLQTAQLDELLHRLENQWATSLAPTTKNGTVLSFFGAKGGVGTTTLAVHFAMYLSTIHKKRTLLVDQQLELGQACVYLGLDGSRYLFQELVRNVNRLDSQLLHGFVAKHSSGLDVLSSPDFCSGTKSLDPEAIATTLEFLRSEYEYVVIDGALTCDDERLPVLDASTRAYLVATPEVGAIRNLSRYVDKLMSLGHSADKLQVVINRSSSSDAIRIEQIEKAMKLPIAIKATNSYAELVRSANLGEPVSPESHTEFAEQLKKWVDAVAGSKKHNEPVQKKNKGLFAAWR